MTKPCAAVLINVLDQSSFELKADLTSIGRDSKCDISISDPLLSRFHAEIHKLSSGRFQIKDSSSSYGTYVAGHRISEYALKNGDEIVVGTTCFRLQMIDETSSDSSISAGSGSVELEFYPSIDSIWKDGKAFLESYEQREGPGRFFHPVPRERGAIFKVKLGSILSVRIQFLARDVNFHVHALVRERRMDEQTPGLLLEFLAEERDREALVLLCANGESIPYFRRRDERIPCRLKVRVEIDKRKNISTIATNISESGIYLVPEHSIELKMLLALIIDFPNQTKIAVRGRVVSAIPKGPQQGTGVEFVFSSAEQRNKMAEQITVLRKSLK